LLEKNPNSDEGEIDKRRRNVNAKGGELMELEWRSDRMEGDSIEK